MMNIMTDWKVYEAHRDGVKFPGLTVLLFFCGALTFGWVGYQLLRMVMLITST